MTVDLERLRWRLLLSAAACVAGALLIACADTGKEVETPTAALTWATLTASGGALASGCQGCHAAAPKKVSFGPGDYGNVVGVSFADCGATKLVDPGNKANSVMYLVLTSGNSCDVSGAPNPMTTDATVANRVGAWIDAGAPQ
jgi:hypothetical protein